MQVMQSRKRIMQFLNSLSEDELNTMIESVQDVEIKRMYNASFRRIIFCLVGERFDTCYKIVSAMLKYGIDEFSYIPTHTTAVKTEENVGYHIFCDDDEFRRIYKDNAEANEVISYCNMNANNLIENMYITGDHQYMMINTALGKMGNVCILSPAGLDSLEKNIEHFNLPYRLYVVYPTWSLYDQLIQVEEKKKGKTETQLCEFRKSCVDYNYGNLIDFFIDGRFDLLEVNDAIPELEIYETFSKIRTELEKNPPEMNGPRINTEIVLSGYCP